MSPRRRFTEPAEPPPDLGELMDLASMVRRTQILRISENQWVSRSGSRPDLWHLQGRSMTSAGDLWACTCEHGTMVGPSVLTTGCCRHVKTLANLI